MAREVTTFVTRRMADSPEVELFHGVWTERSHVRHLHQDFRFGIALAGGWTTRYRGSSFSVGTGQMQLAQPGEISSCDFNSGEVRGLRAIIVPAGMLMEIGGEISNASSRCPFFRDHVVDDEKVARQFTFLHESMMEAGTDLESVSLLEQLVELIVRRFASSDEQKRLTLPPRAVLVARDFIADNLSENPSLGSIARKAGVSPFHLSRLFRRVFGLPPHAYQNHLRILEAKALLARGHSSDEVATSLGFADQSHFIRHFKRQVGTTPHAYRANFLS